VEVDTARGLPSFTIVGLPDTAVQESRERVQAAVKNAGMEFPRQRVTVNLAPADLRKEGPAYDLPIALGVLAASGQVDPGRLEQIMAVGELSLDGSVRHVRGVLPMAVVAREPSQSSFRSGPNPPGRAGRYSKGSGSSWTRSAGGERPGTCQAGTRGGGGRRA